MGFNIFLHSVRLVFNNLAVALSISVPLIVVSILGIVATIFLITSGQIDPLNPSNLVAFTVVSAVVTVFAMIWVAVAWHRFVLMDETPAGLLPAFRGDRMFAYFVRSLIIGVLLFLVAFALSFIIAMVANITGGSLPIVIVLSIALYSVAVVISYRLSPMLPGAAIGTPLSIGDAWLATEGASGQLLILAIITVVASVLIDLPLRLMPFAGTSYIVGIIWSAVTTWIKVMVGISIMTTLYGHLVQKRPLPGGAQPA